MYFSIYKKDMVNFKPCENTPIVSSPKFQITPPSNVPIMNMVVATVPVFLYM